jgi:hypothetical protein
MSPKEYGDQKRREPPERWARRQSSAPIGTACCRIMTRFAIAWRISSDVCGPPMSSRIGGRAPTRTTPTRTQSWLTPCGWRNWKRSRAVESGHAPYRGARGVYYVENWKDPDGFQLYVFVNSALNWRNDSKRCGSISSCLATSRGFLISTTIRRWRGCVEP